MNYWALISFRWTRNTPWVAVEPVQVMFSWFDAAVVAVDGYVRILGRIDDVINVSGHRLGTKELESAALTVPEVARAAGDKMLEYQLHRLELAGLIELGGERIILTEAGVAYGELVKKEKELGGADKI